MNDEEGDGLREERGPTRTVREDMNNEEGDSLTYRDLMMLIAYVILPGRCEILHMHAVM